MLEDLTPRSRSLTEVNVTNDTLEVVPYDSTRLYIQNETLLLCSSVQMRCEYFVQQISLPVTLARCFYTKRIG